MRSSERIVMTGAGGFLGFHTRALLRSSGCIPETIPLGDGFQIELASKALGGADRLIHLAGVNRGTDQEIRDGNVRFARQVIEALRQCKQPPAVVVFANSVQAGNGSVYGTAKQDAAALMAEAVESLGSVFVNLPLPNLFGENGRPHYNSVAATFCHMLARGERPTVEHDKVLPLLHAQHAAEVLVGDRSPESMASCVTRRSVNELLQQLTDLADTYRNGTIPRLGSDFDRDLFNTYRSYLLPEDRLFRLDRHADARGSFFEVVRSRGGSGQTSFSTTVPGITRGQHYHLRKIERFTVLAGSGQIAMRRLFDGEVLKFDVDGHEPVAIDMPTMWAHNIANVGSEILYTAFWSNELFDSRAPDTFPEDV